MADHTGGGQCILVEGRRWRAADPMIPPRRAGWLRSALMAWRREIRAVRGAEAERPARDGVQAAKVALGATVAHGIRDGDFVMMRIRQGRLALLAHPPNPDQDEGLVELNFQSSEPPTSSSGDCARRRRRRAAGHGHGIPPAAAGRQPRRPPR